jgi:enoyl-CoA hydratase/methylglutaconyl-CoA hydratase
VADLVVTTCGPRKGVLTLTLSSVHNRNALSRPLLAALFAGLEEAERDDSIKVVVIRADGPSFCSGADLVEAASGSMGGIVQGILDVQLLMVTLSKPVVARVHGSVRAGGIGLVASADVAIGTSDSTYALTEVRLGLAAAVISIPVLPRLTDRAAADYFLSGRLFDGATAAQLGLLTRAVDERSLDATVDEAVSELLRGSPQGLRATKALLTAQLRQRFGALSQEMVDLSADLFDSPEARERLAAVMAGNRPSTSVSR